ncbi:hypothetical protein FIU86_15570 [Roseovarius sp. THAF9]|uniref:DUF998 domain-containing protein n=1 Tax=Roseovarius sp. THAF9 TaxID=2587847 RepID=UPI0012685F09|nr:DUF998 domain-containing protein [Roseovarius sp. THAF9]QFT94268.1 hypothetical protein FIU86_15570 [Roseovarius sp. THAF9]
MAQIDREDFDPAHRKRPVLMILLGILGIAGCISLVLGTFIAPFYVPNYNWWSDTISDLAAGESEIIMDVALYGFAIGVMATALAASHDHLGRSGWSIGVVSLAAIAGIVVIVGARNEYGDGDNEGVVIHIYLVYMLGALFTIVPATMTSGLRRVAPWAARAMIAFGAVWVVLAPIFLTMGTRWDGLVERIMGLAAAGVITVLSLIAIRNGRGCFDDPEMKGG